MPDRRKKKPACPRCRHKGYWRIDTGVPKPYNKPQFQCDSCGNTWSCGRSGGSYMGNEMGFRKEEEDIDG